MNIYNLGDYSKYEVWQTNHKDNKSYPNRIVFSTNDLDKAKEFQVPYEYEKLIVREEITRRMVQ